MKIYLGNKDKEAIYKNLDEVENIVFCGAPAAGKTTYITKLLKEITNNENPDDVKVVIFDSKKVDYYKFKESPFLLFPITSDGSIDGFIAQMKGLKKIGEDRLRSENKNPTIIVFIDEASMLSYHYKNFSYDISNMMKLSKDTNIHFVVVSQRAACLTKEVIDAAKTKITGVIFADVDANMMGVGSDKPLEESGDVIVSIDDEKVFLHQER